MSQRIARSTNGGFALINALVAATVLAIGLLGSAAMLVHSLQTSRLALQQTQAVGPGCRHGRTPAREQLRGGRLRTRTGHDTRRTGDALRDR